MIPWLGIAAFGGSALTAILIKISNYLKAKKAVSQKASDQAKVKLIKGIKDHEASHPEVLIETEPKDNIGEI